MGLHRTRTLSPGMESTESESVAQLKGILSQKNVSLIPALRAVPNICAPISQLPYGSLNRSSRQVGEARFQFCFVSRLKQNLREPFSRRSRYFRSCKKCSAEAAALWNQRRVDDC